MTKALALAVVLLSYATMAMAANPSIIVTQSLDRTAFWVQPNAVTASVGMCDGCNTLVPLFNAPGLVGLKCLQPAGTKCIYHISVVSTLTLAPHPTETFDAGPLTGIRILVDGKAATPGPAGGGGPGAPTGLLGAFSETVNPNTPTDNPLTPTTISTVAVVTNTVANQLHSISIDLYIFGDAVVTASDSIATIQVFH